METQTVLMRGRYSAALPVAADGDHPKLALDPGGRILVSPSAGGTLQTYDSGADVTNLVMSPATFLHSAFGFNASAAVRYILFFDLAALPANGTAPDFVGIYAAPGTNFAWTYARSWPVAAGIVIASSSTRATLTITLAADMWVSGEFE